MKPQSPPLDDVAVRPPDPALDLTLDDVGLENVQMQVRFDGQRLPARGAAAVSLVDRKSRGIHMSRLFKILTEFSERDLDVPWMRECLAKMLSTHKGLSDAASLQVNFELPILRHALLSAEQGWRTYPVEYGVSERAGQAQAWMTVKVLYSSTCPCSASLSRQALEEAFKDAFTEPSTSRDQVIHWLKQSAAQVASPHSQRSEAICRFEFSEAHEPTSPRPYIDLIESALGTPVQAAVKREDEQEFARLNAQNLMFCEDAARKLKAAFLKRSELANFEIEVRHFESLHAHDVIARARKSEP